MKLKIDGFVLAISLVVALAYFFPGLDRISPIPLDAIGSAGVALIFFFYGLKLSREKIVTGLRNWKLHVLVQCTTFVIFPLIVLATRPLVSASDGTSLWMAFLFLSTLPSTVSSSVVMVSIAKGNVPAAIFNASISGLIGIVVTPLWMGLFLDNSNATFDLGSVYFDLLTGILAPVIVGLLLQKYLGVYAQHYNSWLTMFDRAVILLIIYKSFAESFERHIFSAVPAADFAIIAIGSVALFYTVYYLTGFLSHLLKFNREDCITAQFCGTKKSLIHGTVFSAILFPKASIGIILLPLMLFHAMQIFIISVIATRKGEQS